MLLSVTKLNSISDALLERNLYESPIHESTLWNLLNYFQLNVSLRFEEILLICRLFSLDELQRNNRRKKSFAVKIIKKKGVELFSHKKIVAKKSLSKFDQN